MKKFFTLLILLMCLLDVGSSALYGQATALPYTQDFQTSNDFTFVNGTATNKWEYGTAVGNPAGSMYISNNAGAANAYNNGASSTVQAYHDITIPAGSTSATFSFDWRSNGNDTDWDYFRVWLVPDTFTPTAGTQITAVAGSRIQVGGNFQNQTTWQNFSNPALDISAFAGATLRLVFEWRNDGLIGTNPPAAIDNINLFIPTCLIPTNLTVPTVSPNGATISWGVPTPAPANGYEYIVTTTNTPPAAGVTGTATNAVSVPLTSLVAGTTYYWWVRSICSPTDASTWVAGPSFTPGQIGSGTLAGGDLPIASCFGFNYSQQIYTAAEVAGAIGTNNYITKVRFFVSATASTQANYNQWVVYMGNTTQNNFATTTSWVAPTSLQQVYTGTLPTMTSGTWVELTLTNPFVWNGTSNIVIAVDENSPSWSCTQNWGQYAAGTNRGMLYRNDSTNPDPSAPPTATGRYSNIPRVQLVAEALQPCTTNPPSNIAVGQITPTSAGVSWTPTIGATYVVRYRQLPSGAWTSVNITTPLTGIYTIPGLTESTNYEVQIATICGTQGAFSTAVPFTTPSISYCTAWATSADEFISNVTVTPLGVAPMVSNSTMATASPYYADYTADPARLITLIRGTSNNTISVKRDWPGTVFSCSTIAWIDFNRNGVFEDSERVINQASNNTPINTANFAVPSGAGVYAGNLNLRMRVAIKEGTPPAACGTFSWGEVEDYSVRLIDLQPCSTTAPTPVVSNLTSSSAYVSWLPTANATYRIRWRQGTTGAWLPSPPSTPGGLGYVQLPAGQSFYTITGLEEQTAYQVQIQAMCGTTWGAWTPSVGFTTPPLSYCNMTGTGTNDHIANVTVTPTNFAQVSNTTVQTNYASYTTPVINLEIGSSGNKISVAKGWTGTTFSDAVTVWVDFNRNGIFADDERILISPANTATPVANNDFTVPANAYAGPLTTTMRVVLRRTSAPVMCSDPANGEVEDYAVKLRPCSMTPPSNPTFNTITHNSVNVNWTPAANNLTYVVQYRPVTTPASAWTSVNASSINGNPPLQLTGLTPATLYEVQIAAVCGSTPGTFTAPQTFTTRCDPTPPNVVVSNITSSSALVTWNPIVASASYVLRWREVGTIGWTNVVAPTLPQPPFNSYTITGLDSYKNYEVQVANICVGETNPNTYSNPQVFTTVRTCQVPPPGLTITQLTTTTAEVVWDAFTGQGATGTYILRYRKVGIPSWTTVNVNTNTYTITGLLELTKYEMQVANVCSGTPGNFTPLYYFTTPTITYCQMQSTNSTTEYISKVTAKPNGKPEMINESVGSNYTDYTGTPSKFIEMIQGSTGNQIIIDKNLGAGGKAGVAVWIDFNRNGEFDLDEKILSDGPNENATATATFTVPANAFVSMTDYKYVVMRVAMSKDAVPVNCVSFANGEVEDYTVRISKLPVANTINETDIVIYPNPVSTVLNVKNISKKANYKIYSAAGQLVSSGIILNNKIDVSRLINGVYVIDIDDVQGTAQRKFIKE